MAFLLWAVAAGCGGDDGDPASTTSRAAAPPTTTHSPREAVQAPEPTELAPGEKLTISRQLLASTGYQAACVVDGRRATVQSLPGQVVTSQVLNFGGDGPVVQVTKHRDGSLLVLCRRAAR